MESGSLPPSSKPDHVDRVSGHIRFCRTFQFGDRSVFRKTIGADQDHSVQAVQDLANVLLVVRAGARVVRCDRSVQSSVLAKAGIILCGHLDRLVVRSAIAVGVEPRDPQHFRSVIQLRKETQGIAECLIFIGVSVAIFNFPRRNDRGLKRVLAGGSIRPGVLIARDRLIRLAVNRPVEVCSPWDWQMVCAVAAETVGSDAFGMWMLREASSKPCPNDPFCVSPIKASSAASSARTALAATPAAAAAVAPPRWRRNARRSGRAPFRSCCSVIGWSHRSRSLAT